MKKVIFLNMTVLNPGFSSWPVFHNQPDNNNSMEIPPRNHGQHDAESHQELSIIEKSIEDIQLEDNLDTRLLLKRFLSIDSTVSISLSFADKCLAAAPVLKAHFRAIGSGTCGKVFEVSRTAYCFKVANHPGQSTDTLLEDYISHMKICEIWDLIGRQNIRVHVPHVRFL